MSKLDKFLAKAMEVTIAGDSYMLKPFTVGDLPLLTRLEDKDDAIRNKAIQEVVFKVLKQIDNDATEDLVNDISIEFMSDIMTAVSKINNLDVEDAKKKLLEAKE